MWPMEDNEEQFINSGDFLQKFSDLHQYLEDTLEELIKQDMVDVYVDTDGKFYYKPTNKYIQELKEQHSNEIGVANNLLSFHEIVSFHIK